MFKNVERRFFSANFETREENGLGIVSGRPVVFNSPTDFGDYIEVIDRDALKETDLTDVRLCLNHDTNYVYARSRRNNGNSTMQIFNDADGLRFSAGLNIEGSPKAQDFYSAVSRGDMDKMSFMFTIKDFEWRDLDSEKPTMAITSIAKVYEISCVTFPAYDSTSIEARDAAEVETFKRDLERVRAERLKALDSDRSLRLAKAKYEYISKFQNGGKKL